MTHGGIINAKVKIEERSKIGQRDPIFSLMVWKKSTRIQAYQVYSNFNLILIDLINITFTYLTQLVQQKGDHS